MKDDAEVISSEDIQKMMDKAPIEKAETLEPQVSQVVSNPFLDKESFQSSYDIAKMFAASDMVPQSYQGKPMNCMIAIDMANRLGVNPLMVMQNLWVVRGVPQWSGSACMSLIKGSGQYENVKPVYTGEKGKDSWGCYIQATDIKTGEIVKGTEVTIEMAKKEGWYNKSGSKWLSMPEQMLAYRAAAFFARIYVPNALMGCKVEGEAEDITGSQIPKYKATDIYANDTEANNG